MRPLSPALKSLVTSPFTLTFFAVLATISAFRVPEFTDYLLGGAVILISQTFIGLSLLLTSVWTARIARAAFPTGDPDEITLPQALIVLGAYLACALIIAAVILAN